MVSPIDLASWRNRHRLHRAQVQVSKIPNRKSLLPLNHREGLTTNIIHHPIDFFHLIRIFFWQSMGQASDNKSVMIPS
jgi:hypothetical protein